MQRKLIHFNKLLRQLKYLSRKVSGTSKLALDKGRQAEYAFKLKLLIKQLSGSVSRLQLIRALGVSTFLALSTFAAKAQIFNEPEIGAYGMSANAPRWDAEFTDIDGDGDQDILSAAYDYVTSSSGIIYYENFGTPSCPLFDTSGVLNPFGLSLSAFGNIDAGDLDGDGDFDLMVGTFYPNDILFYENTGTASTPAFAPAVSLPFGLQAGYYISLQSFIDFDADGDLDVLNVGYYSLTYFQRNIGSDTSPVFDSVEVDAHGFASLSYFSVPEAADLDNDGDQDMIFGMPDGSFWYQENIGDSMLPGVSNPFGLVNTYQVYNSPTAGDLDSDGDLDILTGEYYGFFEYYRNEEVPSNKKPTLALIPDTAICNYNSELVVSLNGIGPGSGEVQTVSVSGSSSNTSLLLDPVITYTGGTTGIATMTIPAGASGLVTLTITVDDGQCDNHSYNRSFNVMINDCTGIEETANGSSLRMYPNPLYGNDIHLTVNDECVFELFSTDGTLIHNGKLQPGDNIIELGQLPAGLYPVKISGADKIIHAKLVVK